MTTYLPQVATIDQSVPVFVKKDSTRFELIYFSRDGNNSINYLIYSLSPVGDGELLPILAYYREINLTEEKYLSLSKDPNGYTFSLDNLYGGSTNVKYVNKLLYKSDATLSLSSYDQIQVSQISLNNITMVQGIYQDVYIRLVLSASNEDLLSIPLVSLNNYVSLEVSRPYSSMTSSQFFSQLRNKISNITINPSKSVTAQYYYRQQDGANAQDLTSSVSGTVSISVPVTRTSSSYNRITIQEGTQMLHTTWYEGKSNSYSESTKLEQTRLNQFINEVYQTISDNLNSTYTTSNITKVFYTTTGTNICHNSCHSNCHSSCHGNSGSGWRMNR